MSVSQLEDILKECTNRGNVELTEEEKLFENLWKEQKYRLNKHEKYISESIEIKPIPIFVCKAKMRKQNESIQESEKVFLNICSHHLIPTLSVQQIDINKNGKKEEGIRFPMSCGSQIKIKDNKGNNASTFDIVFHPDILKYANENHKYKINICETAAQNISQKENIIIDGPFKFLKCVYKGIDTNHKQPYTQRIRKSGAAKFVQEEKQQYNINNNDLCIEYKNSNKQIIKSNQEKQDIKLKHEFYIIFIDKDRKKMVMNNIEKLREYLTKLENKNNILMQLKGVQICIDLTKRFKLTDLDLNTTKNGIHLQYNQQILFGVEWNNIYNKMSQFVNSDQVIAKFIKKKCLLKITCPFICS